MVGINRIPRNYQQLDNDQEMFTLSCNFSNSHAKFCVDNKYHFKEIAVIEVIV